MAGELPDSIEAGLRTLVSVAPVDESRAKRHYRERVQPLFWNRPYVYLRTWYSYGRHHDAPLDPFRVLWVHHDNITHHQYPGPKGGAENKRLGFVVDGDWDRDRTPLNEFGRWTFIRDYFERDIPAEETDFFELFCRRLEERGSYWHGCTSVEEFHDRVSYLENLYAEIRDNGIKTTRQLIEEGAYRGPYPENIHVNIGHDGTLIALAGKHRLAIAQVLDIGYIPVNVMVRHADWQATRDAVSCAENPAELDSEYREYLYHPDVVSLWDTSNG